MVSQATRLEGVIGGREVAGTRALSRETRGARRHPGPVTVLYALADVLVRVQPCRDRGRRIKMLCHTHNTSHTHALSLSTFDTRHSRTRPQVRALTLSRELPSALGARLQVL